MSADTASLGTAQERWLTELEAAREALEPTRKAAETSLRAYRGERDEGAQRPRRLPVYTANIQTVRALLFGRPPLVAVTRRHADADDDAARVASTMLERLLNADVEEGAHTRALQHALDDRLLAGLGCVRVRYEVEWEMAEGQPALVDPETGEEVAPAVPPVERKREERVVTDYVHWRDVLWSPARVWGEVRWVAFRAHLSREDLLKRFGSRGQEVPLTSSSREDTERPETPWDRAEVWEIWDRAERCVCWVAEGMTDVLDRQEDPLGLEGFYPCPEPLLGNTTTCAVVPRADHAMMRDLYTSVDTLTARIALLTRAVRVAGVYDKASDGVKRLVNSDSDNRLYPVDNWAAFAEGGGVKGRVDWLPLDQIVAALAQLRDQRREELDLLYQLTGLSDIMRGQASAPGATATEQAIKARFGSVRMQALQDELARFASSCAQLKAQVMVRFFDEATLARESNLLRTPDARHVNAAIALLRDEMAEWRVEVKADAIALQDFAALREERLGVATALSTYISVVGQVVQQMPQSLPYLLKMLQWVMAGVRGADGIESVLDEAIAAAQAPQPPGPAQPGGGADAQRLLALQLKGQQDLAKERAKLEGDLLRIQAETAAHEQQEEAQAKWNTREAMAKQQIAAAVPRPPPGVMRPGGV